MEIFLDNFEDDKSKKNFAHWSFLCLVVAHMITAYYWLDSKVDDLFHPKVPFVKCSSFLPNCLDFSFESTHFIRGALYAYLILAVISIICYSISSKKVSNILFLILLAIKSLFILVRPELFSSYQELHLFLSVIFITSMGHQFSFRLAVCVFFLFSGLTKFHLSWFSGEILGNVYKDEMSSYIKLIFSIFVPFFEIFTIWFLLLKDNTIRLLTSLVLLAYFIIQMILFDNYLVMVGLASVSAVVVFDIVSVRKKFEYNLSDLKLSQAAALFGAILFLSFLGLFDLSKYRINNNTYLSFGFDSFYESDLSLCSHAVIQESENKTVLLKNDAEKILTCSFLELDVYLKRICKNNKENEMQKYNHIMMYKVSKKEKYSTKVSNDFCKRI